MGKKKESVCGDLLKSKTIYKCNRVSDLPVMLKIQLASEIQHTEQ